MNTTIENLSHLLPTHEQIAARAHAIYLESGCQPGHEVDDWLQAEYELMQLPVRKLAELEPPRSGNGKNRRKSIISLARTAMLVAAPGLAQFGHLSK